MERARGPGRGVDQRDHRLGTHCRERTADGRRGGGRGGPGLRSRPPGAAEPAVRDRRARRGGEIVDHRQRLDRHGQALRAPDGRRPGLVEPARRTAAVRWDRAPAGCRGLGDPRRDRLVPGPDDANPRGEEGGTRNRDRGAGDGGDRTSVRAADRRGPRPGGAAAGLLPQVRRGGRRAGCGPGPVGRLPVVGEADGQLLGRAGLQGLGGRVRGRRCGRGVSNHGHRAGGSRAGARPRSGARAPGPAPDLGARAGRSRSGSARQDWRDSPGARRDRQPDVGPAGIGQASAAKASAAACHRPRRRAGPRVLLLPCQPLRASRGGNSRAGRPAGARGTPAAQRRQRGGVPRVPRRDRAHAGGRPLVWPRRPEPPRLLLPRAATVVPRGSRQPQRSLLGLRHPRLHPGLLRPHSEAAPEGKAPSARRQPAGAELEAGPVLSVRRGPNATDEPGSHLGQASPRRRATAADRGRIQLGGVVRRGPCSGDVGPGTQRRRSPSL